MTISCTTTVSAPAIPATPATLLETFSLGWTATARSVGTLYVDGYFVFTPAPSSMGVIAGLTSNAPGGGYRDIEFGFYASKGKVLVIELGVNKTSYTADPGYKLRIERVGIAINYYVNSVLIHTSVGNSRPLVAAAYLYSAGDSISGASLGVTASVTRTGCRNDFLSLTAGSRDLGVATAHVRLLPLVGVVRRQGSVSTFRPLTTIGGSGEYTRSGGQFQKLSSSSGAGAITPEYTVAAVALGYLHTFAHSATQNFTSSGANFAPIDSVGANHAYARVKFRFRPLAGRAGRFIPLNWWSDVSLPMLQGAASGSMAIQNGADISLPSLTGVSYGGAQADVILPSLRVVATGTVNPVLRADVGLPSLIVLASGTTGAVMKVDALLPMLLGTAYSGTIADVLLPALLATASGTVGNIMVADVLLPALTAHVGASSINYMVADVLLPALQAAPSGFAWLTLPALTGYAVGRETIAVTYESYAINLTTGAVTHYTNYPFDNILRFGSKFYGINSTGVWELTGDLDLTAPIDAHIKTFQTDFGTKNMKRLPYVYLSGRSDGGVTIGVTADEGTTYSYPSQWGEAPGNTNHRVVPGKGLRGVYFGLDVSNVAGGSLQLDSISAPVAPTTRAI